MIRFACPDCGKLLKTSSSRAGDRSRCPGCGQLFRVPNRPAHNAQAWARLKLQAIALGVVALLALTFVVVYLGGSWNNARCPYCGHGFCIPEHHGLGRVSNNYTCPNCGFGAPAAVLYKARK